jgi:hypothetical protein
LYVVDIYRGVLQHRMYVTSYLRNQALSRGLDSPVTLGRIYRILPEGAKRNPAPKLDDLATPQLVDQLKAANGWTRDTAQRLLVERHDSTSVQPLRQLASGGKFPGAIHAFWTLHGMGELDANSIRNGFKSSDSKVRATAVRMGESYLRVEGKNEVQEKLFAMANDPTVDVQLQLMFSLGESKSPAAETAMLALLEKTVEHPLVRDAAGSEKLV